MTVVAVLNAGGWGTALATLLGRAGHDVRLWARRPELAATLNLARENASYLPGVRLPNAVRATADLAEAVAGCQAAILVPISIGVRDLACQLAPLLPAEATVVHGTKGFEPSTCLRASQVIEDELGHVHRGRVAALSGPTHAEEVGLGIPTAAVVACADPDVATSFQHLLNSPSFRVYTNPDIIGVELCASVKNVIALAAGIGDGLGGGDNAKAALMTRSLAELSRLVLAAAGKADTVAGLAGIGDLIATCTSRHSRNRRAGELLGRGWTVDQVLADGRQVVEGLPATKATVALAERWDIEMPITAQVHAVLFEGRGPVEALSELMSRDPTGER